MVTHQASGKDLCKFERVRGTRYVCGESIPHIDWTLTVACCPALRRSETGGRPVCLSARRSSTLQEAEVEDRVLEGGAL